VFHFIGSWKNNPRIDQLLFFKIKFYELSKIITGISITIFIYKKKKSDTKRRAFLVKFDPKKLIKKYAHLYKKM